MESKLPSYGMVKTPSKRPRNSTFRIVGLLQFQLVAIVLGLIFWVLPHVIGLAKDASDRDRLADRAIMAPLEKHRHHYPPLPGGKPDQPSSPTEKESYTAALLQRIRGAKKTTTMTTMMTTKRARQARPDNPMFALRANNNKLKGGGTLPTPRFRDRKRYPRVILFVHIHKGAGTLFCQFADTNKASINTRWNCNVQKDQRCCGGNDSMQALVAFANQTNFDFVAIEREMYETMAPTYYDYVVTLRDSKSRYYSHWGHLRSMMPIGPGIQYGGFGNSAWIYGNNTIVDIKAVKRRVPPGMDPLGSFARWSEGQPDNWNTRILCGTLCRPRAKFQITRHLFHYTLKRLETFAHFLFVEDMQSSYDTFAQHYNLSKYSDIASPEAVHKLGNRRQERESADLRLRQEPWNPLMSALDDAIYEFARRRYQNETAEMLWSPFGNQKELDRYFAEGIQMGCVDACCGRCTAY